MIRAGLTSGHPIGYGSGMGSNDRPHHSTQEPALILVTGHIRVPLDQIEALRPHIRTLVAETRKEDGCLLYAFADDINDPGVIRIVERWRDWPSLEAHGKAPHIAAWSQVARGAGITSREVIAHAAGEERIL